MHGTNIKILTVVVGRYLLQHRNTAEHSISQMTKMLFTQTHETKIHSKENIYLNKLIFMVNHKRIYQQKKIHAFIRQMLTYVSRKRTDKLYYF